MIGVEREVHVPAARDAARAGLLGIGLAALLAACALTALVSWNRSFQVDEVEHIHSAYNLSDGRRIYADFWEGHNPLLYTVLRPLVDAERPTDTYRRARALMLGVFAGSLALAAFAATRLAGTPAAGALAVGLLLLHTTFVERGIEVRPDPALAFCVLAALAAGQLRRPALQRNLLQALCLSAAFLFTQKAVFHCTAFGCFWLWQAVRARRPGLVLWPVALWTAPVALVALWLLRQGALGAYLQYNVWNQLDVVGGTALRAQTFGPWPFLRQEGLRNVFFMLLSVASLGHAIFAWAARRPGSEPLAFPAFLCTVAIAYLWLNPGPYPYLHVGVIPFFAVLGAAALTQLAQRSPLGATRYGVALIVAIALVLAASTSLARIAEKARRGNSAQLATLEEVRRITAPDDRVFDLAGLYLRPDGHPVFVMTGIMMARYRAGGFPPIAPTLDANETVAMLVNYRTSWLPEPDLAFLRAHFVQHSANVFVIGTRVDGLAAGESRTFRVLKTKPFRFAGDGALRVDGEPFTRGVLERGDHVLSSDAGIATGQLALDTPDPQPGPPGAPIALFQQFD